MSASPGDAPSSKIMVYNRPEEKWWQALKRNIIRRFGKETIYKGLTVSEWIDELKNQFPDVRAAAAEALGEIGENANKAIPALKKAERDANDDVRRAATDALRKISSKEISRIANVRFFTEPPPMLANIGADFDYGTTRLPEGTIESADQALELDGELISYVKAREKMFPYIKKFEKIKRLQDSERQSFFSNIVKSPRWSVYGDYGASGVRYDILVEYRVHFGVRFDTEELRRKVYLEYQDLFDKVTVDYILKNPGATSDMIARFAMNTASSRIEHKYGISSEEMHAIMVEGNKKWGLKLK